LASERPLTTLAPNIVAISKKTLNRMVTEALCI
jgi:hypothetical protein